MVVFLWLGWLSISWFTTMLLWSIMVPQRRTWPVGDITLLKAVLTWLPTILLFVSIFILGVLDWNHFLWPSLLRWVIGGVLILVGRIVVYAGVFKIGVRATSGAVTSVKTNGLYAYSRNPQYMADIAIFVGWIILSASLLALPLALAGIAVLVLAPFSEEPWLREVYGKPYVDYCKQVRRFL